MKNLIIFGARGRMGQMIAQLAPEHGFTVLAGLDREADADSAFPIVARQQDLPTGADLVIDFSHPSLLPELTAFLARQPLPTVVGTTGYSDEDLRILKQLSHTAPLFFSANMSLGVYALKKAARLVRELVPDWDIEIVEKHHNKKVDAPSGTALMLYQAIASANSHAVTGREGHSPRQTGDIGLLSVRGGTVAGDHEVGFYGDGETITLSHHAENRRIFALGALKAAVFMLGQKPGFYTMEDWLK